MITIAQMFQGKMKSPDANEERIKNAEVLLSKVNNLLLDIEYSPPTCPNTSCQISGSLHGSGDGGFRLQNSKTGAAHSSHKEGQAVDIFDPKGYLDRMIDDELLLQYDLYRESPSATPGWCHLTTRAPRSGRRTFQP